MIINVPVYLEINGRFTPKEGREVTIVCRRLLNEFIRKQSGGHFNLSVEGIQLKVEVLSEQQAINRFGSGASIKPSPPSQVKDPKDFRLPGHDENGLLI